MNFAVAFLAVISASLLLLIMAAFMRTSPKKLSELVELNKQKESLSKELVSISIQQAIWLNSNLKGKNISAEYYAVNMAKVIDQLKQCNISPSILSTIPDVTAVNVRELLYRKLNIASILHDSNDMSKEDFIKSIDEDLDQISKIK